MIKKCVTCRGKGRVVKKEYIGKPMTYNYYTGDSIPTETCPNCGGSGLAGKLENDNQKMHNLRL